LIDSYIVIRFWFVLARFLSVISNSYIRPLWLTNCAILSPKWLFDFEAIFYARTNQNLTKRGVPLTLAAVLKKPLNGDISLSASLSQSCSSPDGREVPLFSVADVSFAPGYATITRTDGMRRVSVSAEVDSHKANANEILDDLNNSFFTQMRHRYPGLIIAMQGEKKKMRESFGGLQIGFPMAVLGIFIIIATIFRSYTQPFIILFTVPFGIIGGVAAHYLLGFNLSMMSIFGMVALGRKADL